MMKFLLVCIISSLKVSSSTWKKKKKTQYEVSYLETNYIPSTIFLPLKDEILDVAGKIYKAGMSLLVIDTENKFVSTGFAKEIARVAQGNFL